MSHQFIDLNMNLTIRQMGDRYRREVDP